MERRSSERIYDDSTLNVSGVSRDGKSFFETTAINDVSSDGISFYIRAEIHLECLLDVEICSREDVGSAPTPLFVGRAHVLRISPNGRGGDGFLVAARFVEPLSPLKEFGGTEEVADELRRAIELDEEHRLLSDGDPG